MTSQPSQPIQPEVELSQPQYQQPNSEHVPPLNLQRLSHLLDQGMSPFAVPGENLTNRTARQGLPVPPPADSSKRSAQKTVSNRKLQKYSSRLRKAGMAASQKTGFTATINSHVQMSLSQSSAVLSPDAQNRPLADVVPISESEQSQLDPGVKSFIGHLGDGIDERRHQISDVKVDLTSGKENSQDNDQVRQLLSNSLRDIAVDEGQEPGLATSGTQSQLEMLPSPSNLVRNGFNMTRHDQGLRDTEQSLDYILELDTERFEKKFEGLTVTQR
jgi:hypothetical protein